MQTCSSLMPFQRQRSCYSISFHLQSPSTTKKTIYNSFSSHNNKSSSVRSLKISCTRSHDMAVVSGDTWDECVLNSDIPVLVEFWAAWCGPCRMVHREMEEIAKEYSGKINCYMLKADENMGIAEKYDIKVVPVVLLFKNGKKCDSVTGTMPNYVYMAAIERLLSS
ncbi:Thioredoxin [Thalictrum thalictroides]|uniref:Thioredoxin n=1 Tax=Thalictrum thalictroides TaxID=46969 RepID=A0A7J6WP40_THATH|nr:Thioredoxin [Thalictrum thalictroides]